MLDEKFHAVDLSDCVFQVPKRYQNLEIISTGVVGEHGVVCQAYDTVLQMPVAIKKLKQPFETITTAKRAFREMQLMDVVKHDNVVYLWSAFTPQRNLQDFEDIYLVMELMQGDLRKIDMGMLDHIRLSYLLFQLLCGVRHLHASGIIHRDLKPDNIAVNPDCTLKILDLGYARPTAQMFAMTPYIVTRHYRAPEIILGMGYTENVDVWSIGCIFGELIRREVLFQGADFVDQWTRIAEKMGTPPAEFIQRLQPTVRNTVRSQPHFKGIPFEELFPDHQFPPTQGELNGNVARDFLRHLLEMDPTKRYSVDDALHHPYVKRWYDSEQVYAPLAPKPYEDDVERFQYTVDQWKERIFTRLMEFEQKYDVFGDKNYRQDIVRR